MRKLQLTLLGSALLLLNAAAQATPVNSTVGLSSPAEVIIDFNSAPTGGGASSLFASQGVVFSGAGGAVDSGPTYGGLLPGNHFSSGGSSVVPQAITNALEIQFSGTVTAAAFLLVTNPGTSTFIASLDGILVESYTKFTDFSIGNDWAGFENITFDTLRIEPSGQNGVIHLDNLSFSGFTPNAAIPEPSALALLCLGLAGLGFGRRRSS